MGWFAWFWSNVSISLVDFYCLFVIWTDGAFNCWLMFNKLYRPNGFHDLIVHKNLKFKISKKRRHEYICPFGCDVMFSFNRLNKYLIPLDIQLWCLLSSLFVVLVQFQWFFSVVFEHKINVQQNSVQICGLQMQQQQLFDIINFQHLLTQMSAYSLAALTCNSCWMASWLAAWLLSTHDNANEKNGEQSRMHTQSNAKIVLQP